MIRIAAPESLSNQDAAEPNGPAARISRQPVTYQKRRFTGGACNWMSRTNWKIMGP